jgi:predicted alpha/beta hydrolase
MMRKRYAAVVLVFAAAVGASGQDRKDKVANDRKQFENSTDWVYNDLPAAMAAAEKAEKPLLVVVRCIP